jgi:tetratricopeptide (TPR) repeat protein
MSHRILGIIVISLLLAGCANLPKPKGADDYVEGTLALERGETDKAFNALLNATHKNPNLIIARSRLGDIYRERSDYTRAAEQYEAVVKLDPYTAKNYYNLGITYQFLNRLQEAATQYLHALQLDPGDAKSSMNAGLCYLSLNQQDDSLKYTKRATELSPNVAAAWTNYGVALDAAGKYLEAEAAYQKSAELDAANALNLYNLGSNLVEQKKYKQALTILEPLTQSHDSAPTRKRLGDAYAGLNRPDDALREYAMSVRQDVNYYPALNEMGRILIERYQHGLELDERQRDSAVQMWKQSLRINPTQPAVEAQAQKWNR